MPMYNLIEYSNIYSKTSESLWKYYRDKGNSNNTVGIDFPVDNNSISFRFIVKITTQTDNNDTNQRC